MTRQRREGDGERALRELLAAEGRDHCPGAPELLALAPDDPGELRAAFAAHSQRIVHLERRGVDHGSWAEFEVGAPLAPTRLTSGPALKSAWSRRFAADHAIFLPGLIDPEPWAPELAQRAALFETLQRPSGLTEFLADAAARLAPAFEAVHGPSPTAPPVASPVRPEDERDLARVALRVPDDTRLADGSLWIKSGRLSTYAADRSLRLRFSFGAERDDDASRDQPRHAAVTALAERLLPESTAVHSSEPLRRLLAEWVTGRPDPDVCTVTQHIAYWNAPHGGALFHHDAFDEPLEGGQRGVVFVQWSGATAWLALSLADLGRHVASFVRDLAGGAAPWLREVLFPDPRQFNQIERCVARARDLRRELARPGCGDFAGLVNRGPEFTARLADAGHGYLLEPGDALVLPNHGLDATCMHSVFCASDAPGYALSMAIRTR